MDMLLEDLPEYNCEQALPFSFKYAEQVSDCFSANFNSEQVLAITDYWMDNVLAHTLHSELDKPSYMWASGGAISAAIKWVLSMNGVKNCFHDGWSVYQQVSERLMAGYGFGVDDVTPRMALRNNIAARVNMIHMNQLLGRFCRVDDERLDEVAASLGSSHEAFGLDVGLLDDILGAGS